MPAKNTKHYIVSKKLGGNRWLPGDYLCACGERLTGMNKFEKHRADARKKELVSSDSK